MTISAIEPSSNGRAKRSGEPGAAEAQAGVARRRLGGSMPEAEVTGIGGSHQTATASACLRRPGAPIAQPGVAARRGTIRQQRGHFSPVRLLDR